MCEDLHHYLNQTNNCAYGDTNDIQNLEFYYHCLRSPHRNSVQAVFPYLLKHLPVIGSHTFIGAPAAPPAAGINLGAAGST